MKAKKKGDMSVRSWPARTGPRKEPMDDEIDSKEKARPYLPRGVTSASSAANEGKMIPFAAPIKNKLT